MRGHGNKITRKKEQAIGALLSQPTIIKAAEVVGVSGQTLKNWLKDPEFYAAYVKARRDCLDRGLARFQVGMAAAVKTLEDVIRHDNAEAADYIDANTRIRAADAFLRHSIRAIALIDLSERLDALESRIEADV